MKRAVLLLAVTAAMYAGGGIALLVTEKPAEATFPGPNGNIAYSGYDGEDYEIYTVPAAGGKPVTVTNNATNDDDPDHSPDGTKIAYEGWDGNDYEIYVVATSGGKPARMTDNTVDDLDPAWSPDGRKIAYSAPDGDSGDYGDDADIWIMPAVGGAPAKVTNQVGVPDGDGYAIIEDDVGPVFSPDGQTIAFRSVASRDNWSRSYAAVTTVGVTGGTATRVSPDRLLRDYDAAMVPPEYIGSPDYSPDGSKIAFVASPTDDDSEIYTVPANGGEATQVTDDDLNNGSFTPTFSPDGSKVAYSDGFWIHTVSAAGGTPTAAPQGVRVYRHSPDWGTQITPTANEVDCGEKDGATPECRGTEGGDFILGTAAEDLISGLAGRDYVEAAGGADTVHGGWWADQLSGGDGNDRLFGGHGRDRIYDGWTPIADANSTNDEDELHGGPGDDNVDARDGDALDTILCGPGDQDVAYYDSVFNDQGQYLGRDTVDPSCEKKRLD